MGLTLEHLLKYSRPHPQGQRQSALGLRMYILTSPQGVSMLLVWAHFITTNQLTKSLLLVAKGVQGMRGIQKEIKTNLR